MRTEKSYYVYMVTNPSNDVLYVGVTNNLDRRISEHGQKLIEGFTKKYNAIKLVYFEQTNDVVGAIIREKELKGWLRVKKNALVESMNPNWNDLFDGLH